MYISKNLGHDRDITEARCSPRIHTSDDGFIAKRPKRDDNFGGDDHRQVSQQNRHKRQIKS